MKQFMSWERLWLFRRQKRRILSLKHPLVYEQFESIEKDGSKLLGWTATDSIDQQLLLDIFNSGLVNAKHKGVHKNKTFA